MNELEVSGYKREASEFFIIKRQIENEIKNERELRSKIMTYYLVKLIISQDVDESKMLELIDFRILN